MIKHNTMDSERRSNEKSDGDSLPNDSDFSKPIWVRYFSVQTDTINQRLLEHNVRTLWLCIPIIIIILSVL
jgi:hypothetical protein